MGRWQGTRDRNRRLSKELQGSVIQEGKVVRPQGRGPPYVRAGKASLGRRMAFLVLFSPGKKEQLKTTCEEEMKSIPGNLGHENQCNKPEGCMKLPRGPIGPPSYAAQLVPRVGHQPFSVAPLAPDPYFKQLPQSSPPRRERGSS